MQNALFEQRLENLKTVIDSNNQALLITNEKNIVYMRNPSRIPAATAEPITPATLGPMACISR